MKSVFKFLSVFFLCALVAGVTTSCSDDDDDEPQIVGGWRMTRGVYWETEDGEEVDDSREDVSINADEAWYFIFNADGTGHDWDADYPEEKDDFTWRLEGSKLTIIYDDYTDEYTISLNGNALVLYEKYTYGDIVEHWEGYFIRVK